MSPFSRFEGSLKKEHRAAVLEQRMMVEEPAAAEPKAKRPKKAEPGDASVPVAVNLPADLAEQSGALADALGMPRAALCRIILAAGFEAIIESLEADRGVTFPLALAVTQRPEIYHRQQVRTIQPGRMETLRHLGAPGKVAKWSQWHPEARGKRGKEWWPAQ